MTPEQFCYWLQGFGELSAGPPTPEQWKSINEHLAAIFQKVTPPVRFTGPAIAEPARDPNWVGPYIPTTVPAYQPDLTQITCAAQPSRPITGVLTC